MKAIYKRIVSIFLVLLIPFNLVACQIFEDVDGFIDDATGAITDTWEDVTESVSDWWDRTSNDIKGWWDNTSPKLETFWDNASREISGWMEDAKRLGVNVLDFATDKFQEISQFFTEKAVQVKDSIVSSLAKAIYDSQNSGNKPLSVSNKTFEDISYPVYSEEEFDNPTLQFSYKEGERLFQDNFGYEYFPVDNIEMTYNQGANIYRDNYDNMYSAVDDVKYIEGENAYKDYLGNKYLSAATTEYDSYNDVYYDFDKNEYLNASELEYNCYHDAYYDLFGNRYERNGFFYDEYEDYYYDSSYNCYYPTAKCIQLNGYPTDDPVPIEDLGYCGIDGNLYEWIAGFSYYCYENDTELYPNEGIIVEADGDVKKLSGVPYYDAFFDTYTYNGYFYYNNYDSCYYDSLNKIYYEPYLGLYFKICEEDCSFDIIYDESDRDLYCDFVNGIQYRVSENSFYDIFNGIKINLYDEYYNNNVELCYDASENKFYDLSGNEVDLSNKYYCSDNERYYDATLDKFYDLSGNEFDLSNKYYCSDNKRYYDATLDKFYDKSGKIYNNAYSGYYYDSVREVYYNPDNDEFYNSDGNVCLCSDYYNEELDLHYNTKENRCYNSDGSLFYDPDQEIKPNPDKEMIYDKEAFVYKLIMAMLPASNEAFIGSVISSVTGLPVLGIAYTDYEKCYQTDDGKNYYLSGFISLYDQEGLTKADIDAGLEISRLDGKEDEKTGYVLAYQTDEYKTHCVALNKYIVFGVNSQSQIFYEFSDYSTANIHYNELGYLYSFDENRIIKNGGKDSFFTASQFMANLLYQTRTIDQIKTDLYNDLDVGKINFSSINIKDIFNSVKEKIKSIFDKKGLSFSGLNLTLNDVFSTDIFQVSGNASSSVLQKKNCRCMLCCFFGFIDSTSNFYAAKCYCYNRINSWCRI